MQKKLRMLIASSMIALTGLLCLTIPVFAVPDDVTIIITNPSNTSMIISWLPAVGATSYTVRYRTDTYPTSPTNGTLAYSGTSTMCTVLSLTAGTSYYICVWGIDGGGNPSANPAKRTITTLLTPIPSGSPPPEQSGIALPTIPAIMTQTPEITGFTLEPFANIIAYADNASVGGLGMPLNNLWETLALGLVAAVGLITYVKMRNFFVAYFIVFILTCFCVALKLAQGWLVPVELGFGAGVWALERFFQ